MSTSERQQINLVIYKAQEMVKYLQFWTAHDLANEDGTIWFNEAVKAEEEVHLLFQKFIKKEG